MKGAGIADLLVIVNGVEVAQRCFTRLKRIPWDKKHKGYVFILFQTFDAPNVPLTI